MDKIGRNAATELIDVTVKLDHSSEYPYGRIKELHKQFEGNRFAQRMMRDLVFTCNS